MSGAAALEVRRVTVSYGARPVLWDVDATFPEGALSAIVEDESLRADLRRRGPVHAAQFSWDRCAAETVDVYRRVR